MLSTQAAAPESTLAPDKAMNDDAYHNIVNLQLESKNVIIETNKEEDYVDLDYEQYFLSKAWMKII